MTRRQSTPPITPDRVRVTRGFDSLLADRQRPKGPRVQDVESPSYVEMLSQPARPRRPCVQVKPRRLVPRSERPDGIAGNGGRRRDVGQRSSVWTPEP